MLKSTRVSLLGKTVSDSLVFDIDNVSYFVSWSSEGTKLRFYILCSVKIMAYDHGLPSRNSTTVLAVTVLDLNDNPPVILGGANLTTRVSEVRLYTNLRTEMFLGGTCLARP